MTDHLDLLERIAARTGVDTIVAEDVLATLVGSMAVDEKPERPFMDIPPYFDRYVTTQISHLGQQIAQLRVEVDRRFGELQVELNRRFGEIDRRFSEMDRRFDRLERWFFAVGIPIILGILAIIIKVFLGTP